MVMSSTARCRMGSMSSAQLHRNGIARVVPMSCLISSCATSVEVAQNGNMFLCATSAYRDFRAASRSSTRRAALDTATMTLLHGGFHKAYHRCNKPHQRANNIGPERLRGRRRPFHAEAVHETLADHD